MNAPSRGAAVAVAAALTTLNLVNYLDRYVIASVVKPIQDDLSLGNTAAGTLGSAFILVYALASPLMGWLGDRVNRMKLISACTAVFGLATLASGLAPGYGSLLAARAVTGVGEAGYGSVTPSLLSDLFAKTRRRAALTVFYAALPCGSALGYLLGGWAGKHFGWRQAFFLASGPALALAALVFFLREPRRGALDPEESPAPPPDATRWLFRRRSFVWNTAGQTLLTFAIGGLGFWMPTYFVKTRGLAVDEVGFQFGAVLAGGGFVGTLLGGQAAAWVARRHAGADFIVGGMGLLLAAPFTVVALVHPEPAVYWGATFVAIVLIFANTGPLNAAIVNVLPPGLRATAFGWNVLIIHVLGDAISPTLVGYIADLSSLRAGVLSIAVVTAAGGAVLLLGVRRLVDDLAHPLPAEAWGRSADSPPGR